MPVRRAYGAQRAEDDLIEIWAYIARDNPPAADRLLDLLDEKNGMLAQNPKLGAARDDIATGVRHFPVGNYLILYRDIGDGVEKVRYVYGMRLLRKLV